MAMGADVLLALLTEIKLDGAKEYLKKTIVSDGKEKRADMCKAFEEFKKDIQGEVKAAKAETKAAKVEARAAKEEAKAAKEETRAAKEEVKAAKEETKSQRLISIYIYIYSLMKTGEKNAAIVESTASSFKVSKTTARRYLSGYNRFIADGGDPFEAGIHMTQRKAYSSSNIRINH